MLTFHVLSVTSIKNFYGTSINLVRIIPFVRICHIVFTPSGYCRLSSQQRTLNLIYGINRIIDVFMHHLFGIGMPVLLCHVMIKGVDLPIAQRADFVKILNHTCAYTSLTI